MAQKKKKQKDGVYLHMKDGRVLRVMEKTGKYYVCEECKIRIMNPGIESIEHREESKPEEVQEERASEE